VVRRARRRHELPFILRVITLNVNGIRSAARKGFFGWLAAQKADIVCLQEIKAHDGDLDDTMRAPRRLHGFFSHADKKGYAGVALYSRVRPDSIREGFGVKEFDAEGRYLEARFGKLSVVSLYLPSGSAGPHRQASKFRFMDASCRTCESCRSGREAILCGDWNIAHKEIDLKNWRSNQKNSGFLPEERAWLTKVFDELGWVDVFRTLSPSTEQPTPGGANRGQAWAKNVGWRIDYQIATPGIASRRALGQHLQGPALLRPRAADRSITITA
jgi:exodeoxyribonuclease III